MESTIIPSIRVPRLGSIGPSLIPTAPTNRLSTERMHPADVQNQLQTAFVGRSLRIVPETGSTNEDASRWAQQGAPEGATIVAEHQASGRGRLGRTWTDEPGSGLLVSVVLHPPQDLFSLGLVPLAAGLAAWDALRDTTLPALLHLKWPNDVLLDGRKVCGILVESAVGASGAPIRLVVGFGLNVNQIAFAEDIANTATSLRRVTGLVHDREALLARLLGAVEARYLSLREKRETSLRAEYEARMAFMNQVITLIPREGSAIRGQVLGIATDGGLRLCTPSGTRVFYSGEVSLRE
jgi:BirA family transcriptional regulator, biotin operon repressor / biotin---[acetyl-CoA-carboxylase] ligase